MGKGVALTPLVIHGLLRKDAQQSTNLWSRLYLVIIIQDIGFNHSQKNYFVIIKGTYALVIGRAIVGRGLPEPT